MILKRLKPQSPVVPVERNEKTWTLNSVTNYNKHPDYNTGAAEKLQLDDFFLFFNLNLHLSRFMSASSVSSVVCQLLGVCELGHILIINITRIV